MTLRELAHAPLIFWYLWRLHVHVERYVFWIADAEMSTGEWSERAVEQAHRARIGYRKISTKLEALS